MFRFCFRDFSLKKALSAKETLQEATAGKRMNCIKKYVLLSGLFKRLKKLSKTAAAKKLIVYTDQYCRDLTVEKNWWI